MRWTMGQWPYMIGGVDSQRLPPHAYFVVSAVFHYLGPSFAVLLFARVDVLGVAWLRIASAALIFALWRRPWRAFGRLDGDGRRLLLAWGCVLALMNCCFYLAISRQPLATVAAIEFLPVVALAALGARTRRNLAALALAALGVYLVTDVQLALEPLGVAFAFANALLFALYIVLADRVAKRSSAEPRATRSPPTGETWRNCGSSCRRGRSRSTTRPQTTSRRSRPRSSAPDCPPPRAAGAWRLRARCCATAAASARGPWMRARSCRCRACRSACRACCRSSRLR